LYIYYAWAKPSYKAPKIGVTLTTPSANSYNLNMKKSYNDIKGEFGGDRYAWGTYAYDITEYVKESGTYVVGVRNQNDGGGDSDFAAEYSFVPPAMLLVYEDTSAPKREYWIHEGADLLMGGGEERPKGGFLSLEECKNTAAFPGDIDLSEVEEAVLGVVSVWGGNPVEGWHSYLYFNDHELGKDVYEGYSNSCSKDLSGLSMRIGSNNAQVGIGLTDVALEDDGNEVIQGDDGDNMMPANALLVITYEEGWGDLFDTGTPANPYPSISGTHNGTIAAYKNITVNRMCTHACPGTGGHTESVKIWNDTTGECVEAHWNGYSGDYHVIAFNDTLTLKKGVIYNYAIRTGSYPQVHHRDELTLDVGIIRCTNFTDTNGKLYYKWIPAITLYYEDIT
jgi:hypothetical protein